MAGLLYLQHAYQVSDEAILARWVENPSYQHLTGAPFYRHRLPIDPSSLARWRKRIGDEGVQWLLTQTIKAGRKSDAIDESSVSRGTADTTVMEKTIDYPSLATTLDEGFIVGMRSFPGNPYDGHTLAPALEQVEILTDQRPDLAVVDRGYRGHGALKTRVLISGTRRGLTPNLIADLRRRSAIKAKIGHLKTNGRLSRSPLKGTLGDALFAVLCGYDHNIRKILAYLRTLLALMIAAILSALCATEPAQRPVTTA